MKIDAFAYELIQDVLAFSEADSVSAHDAFLERALADIERAGRISDWNISYYRTHGVEVSGFGYDFENNRLDIMLGAFDRSIPPVKIGLREISVFARRALNFAVKAKEISERIDKDSEAFEMALTVSDALARSADIRVLIVTNSVSSATRKLVMPAQDGCRVTVDMWDLTRLFKLASSGVLLEPIAVSFPDPLPCLSTPVTDENYSVFLAIIRGDTLAGLYAEYGSRLLELNVRAFLQTRGTVNRGIRETLIHAPERFLAYNNGISATASKVTMGPTTDGRIGIKKIFDLQIVNGGQTTASIHSCFVKNEGDLSQVLVQVKLTVVEPSHLDRVVPEISKFSNTQNKVTIVDFSSNDPFHVELEKVTRSLWAPADSDGGQETKWFYERARGQYVDSLARERTAAKQRAFRLVFPLKNKFVKTDVAKWQNSWESRPWLVSRGAEKNFRAFMADLDGSIPTSDPSYVQSLLAKGILFRTTEKVVTEQNFGGYRANIVTYTIAKLALSTEKRLDFDRIWLDQALSDALRDALGEISQLAFSVISKPIGTTHIGEWTKKEACWAYLSDIPWRVPARLSKELIAPTSPRHSKR